MAKTTAGRSRSIWNPPAAQAPGSNTAAVVTLPARTTPWKIRTVSWSYDGTPTGGKVTVAWVDKDGVSRTQKYYITAGGPKSLPLNTDYPAASGVTVTLAAGGSGVSGTIYCELG